MSPEYSANEEYKRIIRQFMALAFVPIENIQECFELFFVELLAYEHNDNHENFIKYMENTWIGRPRRNPLFRHEICRSRIYP